MSDSHSIGPLGRPTRHRLPNTGALPLEIDPGTRANGLTPKLNGNALVLSGAVVAHATLPFGERLNLSVTLANETYSVPLSEGESAEEAANALKAAIEQKGYEAVVNVTKAGCTLNVFPHGKAHPLRAPTP
jgi:hypothetical protein